MTVIDAAPVWGEGRFFGRKGLIRTLVVGIRERRSFLIYGGPSLGKSSLLHQIRWLLKKEPLDRGKPSFVPLYLSLREIEGLTLASFTDRLYRLLDTTYPKGLGLDRLVLLLDDCELFASPAGVAIFQALQQPAGISLLGVPWNILWAGGPGWYNSYAEKRFPFREGVHLVPLAIFTEKEAYSLISNFLASGSPKTLIQRILEITGRHPYLLHSLLSHSIRENNDGLEMALRQCEGEWGKWCQRCHEVMESEPERKELFFQILLLLIHEAKPINPAEVGRRLGIKEPKPLLDRLCSMGLLDRTLREGEATVWAGCGFFNQWFKRIVLGSKSC